MRAFARQIEYDTVTMMHYDRFCPDDTFCNMEERPMASKSINRIPVFTAGQEDIIGVEDAREQYAQFREQNVVVTNRGWVVENSIANSIDRQLRGVR